MPLYEYLCASCGHRFERIQKFSDPPVAECPSCGGPVEKQVSSPAFQFKGTGWYVTDYAKSGKDASKKSESTSKPPDSSSSSTTATDKLASSSAPSAPTPPAKT